MYLHFHTIPVYLVNGTATEQPYLSIIGDFSFRCTCHGNQVVFYTTAHGTLQHHVLCRDLFEGSSELRLLLCREQTNNGRRSVHVVCACGIFVQHILDAVPIDKYFEMFKPGSGSDGGFVRLKMRLLSNADLVKKEKGACSILIRFVNSNSSASTCPKING